MDYGSWSQDEEAEGACAAVALWLVAEAFSWLTSPGWTGQAAGQPEDLEELYGGLLPSTPERERAAQVHRCLSLAVPGQPAG